MSVCLPTQTVYIQLVGVGGIDRYSTTVFLEKNIAVLLHTYYWSS